MELTCIMYTCGVQVTGISVIWEKVEVSAEGSRTVEIFSSKTCELGSCPDTDDINLEGQFGVAPYSYLQARISCSTSCPQSATTHMLLSTRNIFPKDIETGLFVSKFPSRYKFNTDMRLRWPQEGRRMVADIGMVATDMRFSDTNLNDQHERYVTLMPSKTFVDYATRTDTDYVTLKFGLPVIVENSPVLITNDFDIIAVVGNFLAGALFVNLVFSKLHFYVFWLYNRDKSLSRDEDTASFLKSCKRQDISEVEDELLHSLTFGGLLKYGLQTKHIFEYFTQPKSHHTSHLHDLILENVVEFTADKRVANFLSPDRGDINCVKAKTEDALFQLEEKKKKSKDVVDVYNSLMIYEVMGEIIKIRNIIQSKMGDEAKHARLEEQLLDLDRGIN